MKFAIILGNHRVMPWSFRISSTTQASAVASDVCSRSISGRDYHRAKRSSSRLHGRMSRHGY